tara:strand:+ start:828 stop:1154 length:327 start_codon:yes stop_codon:yes gene_type:complete
MVLESYEQGRGFEGNSPQEDVNTNLRLCLIDAGHLRKRASNLTYRDVRKLMQIMGDYKHFRDVAVKLGENLSRFPRRISVPEAVARRISELEERDRKISKLKVKLGRF